MGVQLPPTTTSRPTTVGKLSAEDTILHVFPENIAKAVADNAVLQVVVFSLIFAIALAMISEEKRRPMLAFCESLAETMFKFTNIVMYMAPLGVGAAIAYTVGHSGLGDSGQPAEAAADPVRGAGRLHPGRAAAGRAAVPGAAEALHQGGRRAGDDRLRHLQLRGRAAPRDGADGGHRRAAADRGFRDSDRLQLQPDGQLALSFGRGDLRGAGLRASTIARPAAHDLLTLMLTSKGVAGVSRAALVILLATATSVGLPTEPVFMLLGIDQLLDMGRTAVNVLGNCLATVVMAKWEGEFQVQCYIAVVNQALPGNGIASGIRLSIHSHGKQRPCMTGFSYLRNAIRLRSAGARFPPAWNESPALKLSAMSSSASR